MSREESKGSLANIGQDSFTNKYLNHLKKLTDLYKAIKVQIFSGNKKLICTEINQTIHPCLSIYALLDGAKEKNRFFNDFNLKPSSYHSTLFSTCQPDSQDSDSDFKPGTDKLDAFLIMKSPSVCKVMENVVVFASFRSSSCCFEPFHRLLCCFHVAWSESAAAALRSAPRFLHSIWRGSRQQASSFCRFQREKSPAETGRCWPRPPPSMTRDGRFLLDDHLTVPASPSSRASLGLWNQVWSKYCGKQGKHFVNGNLKINVLFFIIKKGLKVNLLFSQFFYSKSCILFYVFRDFIFSTYLFLTRFLTDSISSKIFLFQFVRLSFTNRIRLKNKAWMKRICFYSETLQLVYDIMLIKQTINGEYKWLI